MSRTSSPTRSNTRGRDASWSACAGAASLAEIQVFDTGIGIPADKLNTVFQEFTRLDDGMREAEGLGLGLSIVDRIARVLRLELRIDSERGKGTCFSVILPISAAAELGR